MKFDYKLKKEDYIRFNLEYLIDSDAVRRFFYFQKLFIALSLFLALYFVRKLYRVPILHRFIFYIAIFLGWSIVEGLLLNFIIRRKIAADMKKKKSLLGDKTLSIEEGGIHDLSKGKNYLVAWKDVKFVDLLDDYIYIFTSVNSGYIIPKRDLGDRLDEIIARIYENVDK